MTADERALEQFLAAYFHQDWSLDAASPEEVVAEFLRDHPAGEQLLPVVRALHGLIDSGQDDARLSHRLTHEFGSFLDPRGDGESTRQWLRWLVDRIERELRARGG
jgi:hypothetical protein